MSLKERRLEMDMGDKKRGRMWRSVLPSRNKEVSHRMQKK
jgi:hypothetical protein